MRLTSAPDSSRLVLQSLLPSSSVSAGPSQLGGPADTLSSDIASRSFDNLGGRRYSGQAGETAVARDTHTDQMLQIFNSTLQQTASSQSRDLAPVAENSPLSSAGDHQSALAAKREGLRRQGSSPLLSSLATQTSSMVHGYLKRRASANALFPVRESKEGNAVALATQDSPSSDYKAAGTDEAGEGALQKAGVPVPGEAVLAPSIADPIVDTTDATGSKSQGFGILNRTRKFGAWLGQVTTGEKVEVTKKDLNAFAPTSF